MQVKLLHPEALVVGQATALSMTETLDKLSALGSLLNQRHMATYCKSPHFVSRTQGNESAQLLSYCCAYMYNTMRVML